MVVAAPFRLERDMFAPLLSKIPELFGGRGEKLRVLREPIIADVIPDVLIGTWDGDLPYRKTLTNVARHILAWLQGSHEALVAQERVEEELFLTKLAASRALQQLTKAGAVVVHDSGELQLVQHFRAPAVALIAIELKMTRWREALAQAQTYLRFADEAYVVLDGRQVEITKAIREEFELSDVGLLIQQGDAVTSCLPALQNARHPSADRLLALQKLAAGPYCLV